MKSILSCVVLLAMAAQAGHAQKATADHKDGHYNVSAAKAKELVSRFKKAKKPIVILDIRTPEEHAGSHIEGALLMDFLADDFKASLGKLDRKKAYLVHCRSGGRSSSAFALMKRLGFKSVYHLDGGIIAWKKAGGVTK